MRGLVQKSDSLIDEFERASFDLNACSISSIRNCESINDLVWLS
jgi:hypothetical protein